jgi:glycine cleavage system aminomethyltransferase T
MDELIPSSLHLAQMNFMTGTFTSILGCDVILTRCGYTGEDGFEVSVPSENVVAFTRKLLGDSSGRVLEAVGTLRSTKICTCRGGDHLSRVLEATYLYLSIYVHVDTSYDIE